MFPTACIVAATARRIGSTISGDWILATGNWADSGVWNDSANWID